MSRSNRQMFVEKVDRVVDGLRASGFSEAHLRWGALVAAAQGLPLRDAIVQREARRREAMETETARAAWENAIAQCRQATDDSTMSLWIEPLELVGEDGGLLVLAAPTGIRSFVERRYVALLSEAVRHTGQYGGVRIARVSLPIPMREVYAR